MFSSGFRSTKFSTSARLAIHRLKLLERKKTEEAQKARKEIADYLSMGKDERARIRVEHIIREDYLVEAMEIVELFIDLLLARLGLITSSKVVDPSIEEAVASVIWIAPRLSADVAELKTVSEQLAHKYGKEFVEVARRGECDSINVKLKARMSVLAPPRKLVENYLVEIAKSHGVIYEPDPCILSPPEIEGLLMDLGDEALSGSKKGGGGGGGGGGMGMHVQMPPQQPNYPSSAPAYPPPGQAYPPASQGYPPPAINPAYPPQTQAYPPQTQAYPPPAANHGRDDSQPPPYGNFGPSRGLPARPNAPPVGPSSPRVPPYSQNDPMYPPNPQAAGNPPPAPTKTESSMPVLPQVPTNSFPPLDNSVGGGKPGGGEDVDFDDLTRRFEELKKKK